MNTRAFLLPALLAAAAVRAGDDQEPAPSPWLETHQRLCFAVTPENLEEVVSQGANVICGGTNAAGPGFAGGPYGLNEDAEVIDIRDGKSVDLEPIRARVERAHELGVKVLGEATRMMHGHVLTVSHPEWQELGSPEASPVRTEPGEWKTVIGCWNSGFGEYFIEETAELVKRLGWDGYNLDGFGCWTQCYCPACRESYRAAAGADIPRGQDLDDPAFRRYLKWRLARYTDFVGRWQRRLKAVKPDFAACPWSTGPGRWWHWSFAPFAEGSDAMHRRLDAPMLELFWDFPPDQGTNLLGSFTVRYYRGLMGDRPAWFLPYYCTQGQMNMQAPAVESAFRTLTVITNGGLAAQGVWQQSREAPLGRYFDLIRAREPWTAGARSLKWAALFVSESSRLLYGVPGKRSEVPLGRWIGSGVDSPDSGSLAPGERRLPAHMESAVGVFRAMMEEHLPLDIITEEDVQGGDALMRYRVLILPNTACISDRGLENIRAFVRRGGGLVALQESSLADEHGTRREDFGLADLFGASFRGAEDFSARWPSYPSVTEVVLDPHPITEDPVIAGEYRRRSDRLNYIGWAANVELREGAKRAGRRLGDPERPFLVLSEPGRGRVAYYAADLGQSYFIAPYRYQRRLLVNAVRWAAGEAGPPAEVKAPMCVQAAFYEQESGGRLVVHLLNEINTTADRALPENNPSMREEVVPIHDIRVIVRRPAIESARLEPESRRLGTEKKEDSVEIVVPRLELHSMVVIETATSD